MASFPYLTRTVASSCHSHVRKIRQRVFPLRRLELILRPRGAADPDLQHFKDSSCGPLHKLKAILACCTYPCCCRGGVPICFPQFSDFGPLGQHGFARNSDFTVLESGKCSVTMVSHSNYDQHPLYDENANCSLLKTAVISRELRTTANLWISRNTSWRFSVFTTIDQAAEQDVARTQI